LTKKTPSATR